MSGLPPLSLANVLAEVHFGGSRVVVGDDPRWQRVADELRALIRDEARKIIREEIARLGG